MYEEDCSCDSVYMKDVMIRVEAAIRMAHNRIPLNQTCYLVMENAGGHGTADTIKLHTDKLRTRFNITTIFQVPRSPFTNVLDLGVWTSLQSTVGREQLLKRCMMKALENTVILTWNSTNLNQMMINVFG